MTKPSLAAENERCMNQDQPDFYNPIGYSIAKRLFFRFPFAGLDEIQVNHSQLHQDMFVLSLLQGKRQGSYLDIGAHEPVFLSNTCLLERSFGWKGLGLELDEAMVRRHQRQRRNPCLAIDAVTADYAQLLREHQLPQLIDYLSIDIDPAPFTLAALRRLPHHDHRFRIITFEHDLSLGGHRERLESREFLQGLGYSLLINDISWGSHVVEDWWVDLNHVDADLADALRSIQERPNRHDQILYAAPAVQDGSAAGPSEPAGAGATAAEKAVPMAWPAAETIDLLVEGWRQLNHSYSLVNQWQLNALLDQPLSIRHREVPPYASHWTAEQNGSGMPAPIASRLAAIEEAKDHQQFSATYRISFPYSFTAAPDSRLFVFGTVEHCLVAPMHEGRSLEEAVADENLQIITPSHWSRRGFLAAGFRERNVHVVPHGIQPECFYVAAAEMRALYRQIFGFGEADQILLNVSALTINKGIDLLLRAFAVLKPRHPNLKLVIKHPANLYSRTMADVCREMVFHGNGPIPSEAMMNDVIVIGDNLDLEAMHALYAASDLYVSPYRAEGFNLPALEAAASGLPILVTAGGSTDDYFSSLLGLQIASDPLCWEGARALRPDFDSLLAGIEALLANPGLHGGAAGSAWIHRQFSWRVVCDALLRKLGFG